MSPLLGVSIYWDLPILIIVISVVYSATRFDRWDLILAEALRWGLRMSLFLVGIGAALFVFSSPRLVLAWVVLAIVVGISGGMYVYSYFQRKK